MKCIDIIKKTKLDKKLMNNRIARLERVEKRKEIQRLLKLGSVAETVIFEKLKKEIPKNSLQTIKDNNITNKYSTMDFTYYMNNQPIRDVEHKHRIDIKHDQYADGLMYGKNKFDYGLERLKEGITHRVYWTCSDGIYYWELNDPELQKEQFEFGKNCNMNIKQSAKDVVYIKCNYLNKM